MAKMAWMTGAVAVAAIGLAVSAMPRSASAIAFDGACETAFETAAGTQSGSGSYANACATDGTLDDLIDTLDGDRSDAGNWSVFSGSTYGVFEVDGLQKVTFVVNVADNNHVFGVTDAATQTNDTVLLPETEDAAIGDMVFFTATEDFVLFAENIEGANQIGNRFFSDRSLNSFGGVDEFVHFLILEGTFDGLTEYLIIAEDQVTFVDDDGDCLLDLPGGAGGCGNMDDDFNDAGILMATVPEPGTLALLGAGLVGFGFYRRRRA